MFRLRNAIGLTIALLGSALAAAENSDTLVASISDEPLNGLAARAETLGDSSWSTEEIQNDFSDINTYIFSTTALNDAKCRWGTKPAILIMECAGGQVTVRFQTHCRISTSEYDSYGEVRLRADRSQDFTLHFLESEDHRSLGLWETDTAIPFVRSIFGKTNLIARIKPYADEPFNAKFNVTGLEQTVEPYKAECGLTQTLNN